MVRIERDGLRHLARGGGRREAGPPYDLAGGGRAPCYSTLPPWLWSGGHKPGCGKSRGSNHSVVVRAIRADLETCNPVERLGHATAANSPLRADGGVPWRPGAWIRLHLTNAISANLFLDARRSQAAVALGLVSRCGDLGSQHRLLNSYVVPPITKNRQRVTKTGRGRPCQAPAPFRIQSLL